MEQENKMKNQIGLQSKRLAQMKIEEERRRKHMMARREHEERCNEEEQLRNCKMDEVAQMEREERLWANWLSEMSNKDSDFWYNHGRRKNFYMTAEQCLSCDIIDEII